MKNIIPAIPLYNFLKYCNNIANNKSILDCGAGGSNPPLSLFHEFGYKTYGIEISDEQLEKANSFCREHDVDLNIKFGDMKDLPFNNEFFSFLYSYNTSVHMKKSDLLIALSEFHRVLKVGGLCYLNFLGEDCDTYGKGKQMGEGEFLQVEEGCEVLYCHYKDNEMEQYFGNFEIIYKEKRVVKRTINAKENTSSFLDYILMKK